MRRDALVWLICVVVAGCSSGSKPPEVDSKALQSLPTMEKLAKPSAPQAAVAVEAPPVLTEADIESIEAAIKKRLPKAYRSFLLEHSGTVAEAKKRGDARGGMWGGGFPWFKTKDIIRENKGDMEFLTLGEKQPSFGDDVVLIASGGGGDYDFVYLDEAKPGIWYFDHEELSVKQLHKTFEEYLAHCMSENR